MLASGIATTATYNTTLVYFQHISNCESRDLVQQIFPFFKNKVPLINDRVAKHWANIGEAHSTDYNSQVIVTGKNTTHAGYRQNWKYVQTKAELKAVKKAFQLSDVYRAHAYKELAKAQNAFSNTRLPVFIGVYARILNLQEQSSREYGYNMAPQSFYRKAFEAAQQRSSDRNLIFIIVSDSIKEAKALLSNMTAEFKIYFSSSSEVEDFATLSVCHNSITTGGTFGYWAALLAGGTTFYFSEFATPGSKFAKYFNNDNFYRPEWISIGY